MTAPQGLRGAPGPQGDQLLVLAAYPGIAEQLRGTSTGTSRRPEPGNPGAKSGDLAIRDWAQESAVTEFLDTAPEGAIAAFRTAMEGHMDPQEVVAREDVPHQGSGTAHLAGVLA
jgi:hypothetical protein